MSEVLTAAPTHKLAPITLNEQEVAALVPHEYCKLIPVCTPKEYEELRKDIKLNGVLDPIILYEFQILDGRTRDQIAKQEQAEAHYLEYKGDAPVRFVISKNAKRRHLTPGQLAAIAEEVEPFYAVQGKERMSKGGEARAKSNAKDVKGKASRPYPSNDEVSGAAQSEFVHGKGFVPTGQASELAAKEVGASGRTVRKIKRLRKAGAVDLIDKIKDGSMTVNEAEKQAGLVEEKPAPKEAPEPVVAKPEPVAVEPIVVAKPEPATIEPAKTDGRRRTVGPGTAVVEINGRMPPGINADNLVRKTKGPRGDTRREIEAEYGKPMPRRLDPTSDEAKVFVAAVKTVAARHNTEYAAELAASDEAQFVSDRAAASISVRDRIERMERHLEKKNAAAFDATVDVKIAQLVDDAFNHRGKMHDSLYMAVTKLLNQRFKQQEEDAKVERESLQQQREQFERLSKDLPQLVSLNEYRIVRSCLHVGDRIPDEERRREAFSIWQRMFPDWLVKKLK